MKTRYVDIDGYWGIIFVYEFDMLDSDELAAIMDSFGLDDYSIRNAICVLLGINGGMTISRPDLRMSVVFVGQASSAEQFFDTLAHECDHVQDSILRCYDMPHGGEDAAWLQGYIMRGITKWLIKDGYIIE